MFRDKYALAVNATYQVNDETYTDMFFIKFRGFSHDLSHKDDPVSILLVEDYFDATVMDDVMGDPARLAYLYAETKDSESKILPGLHPSEPTFVTYNTDDPFDDDVALANITACTSPFIVKLNSDPLERYALHNFNERIRELRKNNALNKLTEREKNILALN